MSTSKIAVCGFQRKAQVHFSSYPSSFHEMLFIREREVRMFCTDGPPQIASMSVFWMMCFLPNEEYCEVDRSAITRRHDWS